MTTLIKPPPPRKAFDALRQTAWDSTSLTAAKKCPRYYYYTIIQGWRPKAGKVDLKFGILFHSALEELDRRRTRAPLTDQDLMAVIRKAAHDAGSVDPETGKFEPWRSAHEKKNLETLIRGIVWYFDTYREDPCQTITLENGAAAVELSFRIKLPFESDDILYCGHIDRLVNYGDQDFVLDRKTTGYALAPNFFAQFSPSVQMTGYTFSTQVFWNRPVAGAIIDAMQVLVGSVKFARHPVTVTPGQIEEWLVSAMYQIKQADKWVEQNFWPLNESVCGMYGGCTMQPICSRDPSVRDKFLPVYYEQEHWDPLKVRGGEA